MRHQIFFLWLLSSGAALLFTAATSLSQDSDNAQTTAEARPDPSLRGTLEATYHAWRAAMAKGDLEAWEAVTALSRQMDIRNRIVSQKAPFPQALFAEPGQAPSLKGLASLGVLSTGQTATSTYFGRADFGESDVPVSNNLIVLEFQREDDGWKFDKLRLVKTGNDGEVLLQIRNRDFSFLEGEEFQPIPSLPPIPQPVGEPELIGEMWVSSEGYETEIRINGHLCAQLSDSGGKDLVMGGIKRGNNSITIQSKSLPPGDGSVPRLEVAIYAAAGPGEPAKRVFHYRPGEDVPATVTRGFRGE